MTGQTSIHPSELHPTLHPGDDFYQYANWGWLKANPLPEEKSRYGILHQIEHNTYERIHSILKDAANRSNLYNTSPEIMELGKFYRLGMDIRSRNRQGFNPIKKHLDRIGSIKTKLDAWQEVGRMHSYGIYPWFKFYSTQADYQSKLYIGEIFQGGIGFHDKRYYFNRDKVSEKLRTTYHNYISGLFLLIGNSIGNAHKIASEILNLETQIAKISMFSFEIIPSEKLNNPLKFTDLERLTPHFDWNCYFKELGIVNPDHVNVEHPGFIGHLDELIENSDLKTIKHYLSWYWLNSCAPYLSENFMELHFGFFGRLLSGQQKMKPLWEAVVHSANLCLGIPLGQEYVKRYFSAEARELAHGIFDSVRQTMRKNLMQIYWMSESSRKKAVEKLDQLNLKIGYPDRYTQLTIPESNSDSYIETILTWRHHHCQVQINRIGAQVDQGEWMILPQMVNAFYNPINNEIGIPAGILQPPIFSWEGDIATNYGALGVMIGHELIHVFDAQGRLYNAQKNVDSWWTGDEEKEYQYRIEPLLNQINQNNNQNTGKENGHMIIGENVADLGGIRLALESLQNLPVGDQPAAKIMGFNPIQRFFLAYARIWVQQMTKEEEIRRNNEDIHSVGEDRVNFPLAHMDEFYKAFKVKQSHRMFLSQDKRAKIW